MDIDTGDYNMNCYSKRCFIKNVGYLSLEVCKVIKYEMANKWSCKVLFKVMYMKYKKMYLVGERRNGKII